MARTGSMADNFIRRDAMEASIPTMAPGRMRWTHAALLVAGYVLLDWASYIHAMHGLNITPWSPGPALGLAFLLGGLVVTEQVFNLNGLGMLFVEAISHRDYTLTQALVLLVATFFLFVNFFVDIAYGLIDPRIRYR